MSLNGRCLRCGKPIHHDSPDALDFFWRCSTAGSGKCLRVNGEPETAWVVGAVVFAVTSIVAGILMYSYL